MTPEPWRSLARPTYSAEWTECRLCGKRYLVHVPPTKPTLADLEKAPKHVCRTQAQEQALREYDEEVKL